MTETQEFNEPLDVMNRAAQHLGVPRITSFGDPGVFGQEIVFAYDKLRVAELKRNVWKFATRTSVIRPLNVSTRLITPQPWLNNWVYRPGSIVSFNGVYYVASLATGNLNQTPGGGTGGFWDIYFGPLSVMEWESSTDSVFGGYWPGELVYVNNGLGWVDTFVSVTNANATDPETPDVWSTTAFYHPGDVVAYTDSRGTTWYYMSLVDLNIGNEPDLSAVPWNVNTTYAKGATVCGSDGLLYTSTQNGNLGNVPSQSVSTFATVGPWYTDGTQVAWTQSFAADTTPNEWRKVVAGLTHVLSLWPAGAGPENQSFTKNVYRLPSGFLRRAPQDPNAGAISFLGAAGGIPIKDWEFSDNFLITRDFDPIPLRFVANMQRVNEFDPMFCEGLAARIGFELAERVTQDLKKKQAIGAVYQKFMTEARLVNGIETGPTEPPEDSFVTCRI